MNYYDILEVSPLASPEVIRAAYKSLMQRCHPDKNPGDIQAAHRAARVVQAYGILSDADRRLAYDAQYLGAPPTHSPRHPVKNQAQPRALIKNLPLYAWILMGACVVLVVIILFSRKNKYSNKVDLKTSSSLISINKESEGKMAAFTPLDPVSTTPVNEGMRTVTLLLTPTTVVLSRIIPSTDPAASQKPPVFEATNHSVTIPSLLVRVGRFDTDKVRLHLETRKQEVTEQLTRRLALANYEELIKIDGDKYLKGLILDALNDAIGTSRQEAYPSALMESPERYGIVDVILPGSYALTTAAPLEKYAP